MTERYFRWDFDVVLVWRSTDGDVDEAQFVWDSESQIATPALIGDPSGVASYQLEIGDEDRYEVTEPDEIAAVKEALALKVREHEKDTRDADLAALRERLAAAEALSESRRVTLLAKSEELAADWKRAETAEALVRELAAVVKEDRPRSYTEHANGMACGYPDSCWACRHDAALAGLSAAARKEIEG